jgi:hypothetical protein
MLTTYPLNNAFYGIPGKKPDPHPSRGKSKDADNFGLDSDQAPHAVFGPPEVDEDDYPLGCLIYML